MEGYFYLIEQNIKTNIHQDIMWQIFPRNFSNIDVDGIRPEGYPMTAMLMCTCTLGLSDVFCSTYIERAYCGYSNPILVEYYEYHCY